MTTSPYVCCQEGCVIFSDDFNRTELGCRWIKVSGDWKIETDKLKETGNSGATVRFTEAMTNPWMRATISIIDEQASDTYILYVSWKDVANHLYAKFVRDAGTGFTLTIHSVIGGTDTTLDTTTGNLLDASPATRWFSACVTPNGFYAEIEEDPLCWAGVNGAIEITGGLYAGIGHENSHASYFDDWELAQTWTGSEYCTNCGECLCETFPVADQLTATYQGEGDCDTLDEITLTLNRKKCGAPGPQYLGDYTGTISGGCLDGLVFDLFCNGGDGIIPWLLVLNREVGLQQACINGIDTEEIFQTDDSSRCSPFKLVFKFGPLCTPYGGQLCPDDCLPCGRQGPAVPPPEYCTEYTITITE